jgi:deazaflavin-dependent oxidoreductase (nitroreductase family)
VKDDPASGSPGPTLLGLKSIPSGALRLAFRLPIYLYRLNLGWLLGHRFLQLVHRGRRSGLLRETVLEVLHYDPATGESVVLSAWGEKADWYRNVEATPALEAIPRSPRVRLRRCTKSSIWSSEASLSC